MLGCVSIRSQSVCATSPDVSAIVPILAGDKNVNLVFTRRAVHLQYVHDLVVIAGGPQAHKTIADVNRVHHGLRSVHARPGTRISSNLSSLGEIGAKLPIETQPQAAHFLVARTRRSNPGIHV